MKFDPSKKVGVLRDRRESEKLASEKNDFREGGYYYKSQHFFEGFYRIEVTDQGGNLLGYL